MCFQSYLKTLKKKQKEVTQKHQKYEGVSAGDSEIKKSVSIKEGFDKNTRNKHSFSDDSDLASLAREFEEEELVKESPFIRKVNDISSFSNIYTINQFIIIVYMKVNTLKFISINITKFSNISQYY